MQTDGEIKGTGKRTVLFVSNGLGEDSIAARVIGALPDTVVAHAYPVIGDGDAFYGLCPIVGPRSHVPSQGWRHAKHSVLGDLPAMVASVPPALGFLKSARSQYDRIVVVGDSVGVVLALLARIRIDLYLDVFKTGHAHRYSRFERFAIGRTTSLVMCRDDMLAGQLTDHGIAAVSHGNIMADTVTFATTPIGDHGRGLPVVGMLPGSRRTTPDNFALQVEVLARIGLHRDVTGYCALAPGLDPHELARRSGLGFEPARDGDEALLGTMRGPGVTIAVFSGATGDVITASAIVLSQAGTATQQALAMGKPVITYFPAGHRKKRMADEQALMGEARLLCNPDPDTMAQAALRLLADPTERDRLGAIGRQRLGGTGTLDAIVQWLTPGAD